MSSYNSACLLPENVDMPVCIIPDTDTNITYQYMDSLYQFCCFGLFYQYLILS